ncbi:hypothetical protein QQ045_028451 [Rhodiola kirilowii]
MKLLKRKSVRFIYSNLHGNATDLCSPSRGIANLIVEVYKVTDKYDANNLILGIGQDHDDKDIEDGGVDEKDDDLDFLSKDNDDQHISVEVHNEVEDIKMIDSPWLLMGDFNSLASWSEKKMISKKGGVLSSWECGFNTLTSFNKVKQYWEGQLHINPLVNFGLKLKRTRAALISWNWETFGDVNRKIKETQMLLDSLEHQLQNGWRDSINSQIIVARQTLNNLLRFQLGILEEKAKVSWYKDGDRNSSFFHASIKERRAQNTIKLELEDGSISDDGDVIGLRAAQYFNNLFGDLPASGDIQLTDLVQKVISDDENDCLSVIPDLEEIQHNVFSMNSSSSLGPAGFTGKFFTSCWDIIKEDLQAAVQAFFEGLQLPKIISSTSIVLIPKVPKVPKAGKLDQVRPISLCNFIHKILSRIPNSRLTIILKRVISQEQSGFLERKYIHDCIGMAHDMVHDINVKSFGGKIMMKIDMLKAYDRISWRFILKMMAAMGFSEKMD